MTPSYAAGMLLHLLDGGNAFTRVETFTAVGAVGTAWPPNGIKLTLADGTAMWLSVNTTSPDQPEPAGPDTFQPDHLTKEQP